MVACRPARDDMCVFTCVCTYMYLCVCICSGHKTKWSLFCEKMIPFWNVPYICIYTVCCSVLQCVAVCCSVLKCVLTCVCVYKCVYMIVCVRTCSGQKTKEPCCCAKMIGCWNVCVDMCVLTCVCWHVRVDTPVCVCVCVCVYAADAIWNGHVFVRRWSVRTRHANRGYPLHYSLHSQATWGQDLSPPPKKMNMNKSCRYSLVDMLTKKKMIMNKS